MRLSKTLAAFALSAPMLAAGPKAAGAAPGHAGGHGHHQEAAIGAPGTLDQAGRTVSVVMTDNAYEPARITVREGETVHFVVRNGGSFIHEFSLGTDAMNAAHREKMAEMMARGALSATAINRGAGGMDHDDPNSLLLEAGGVGDLVWTFSQAGEIEFGCNVPGHYESGMVGEIRFLPAEGAVMNR